MRALVFMALLATACAESADAPRASNPVVLIGVDGLDPVVVDELLEAERLPNLAMFAERGVVARLQSMTPTHSPVIWTSIATGQTAERHGVVHFLDERERPFTSNARRVPALWNVLSERDRTVNCVGWWVTWPAEPINGAMVASYAAQAQAEIVWKPGTWESLADQTYPPALIDEVAEHMIFESDADQIRERLWSFFERPAELTDVTRKAVTDLAWTYAADLSFAAVAAHLMKTRPADLNMVYLALPDVAGHRFWAFHEPSAFSYEVPAEQVAVFGEYVRRSYEHVDRLIGELVQAAPTGANIIVVSDHGMHAAKRALDQPGRGVSGHHEDGPAGVVAAMGPQIRTVGNLIEKKRRGLMGEVLDVAPFVLQLLDEPAPEHWPKVRRGVALTRMLDETWRTQHALRTSPDVDASFRPATDSVLPAEGLDEEFMSAFRALGYTLGDDELDTKE